MSEEFNETGPGAMEVELELARALARYQDLHAGGQSPPPERFVEESAVHASYAQGLLEAFLIIQGVELSPYLAPSEDLVLWISSTLSNDVILYGDGVLVASSRREFFSSGLLPEILDGEVYQALVYDRKPFIIQRTRLGGYSFQTLTVPYESKTMSLFISLPFPYEREQVNKATREIVEFLVVLSAFFPHSRRTDGAKYAPAAVTLQEQLSMYSTQAIFVLLFLLIFHSVFSVGLTSMFLLLGIFGILYLKHGQ